MSDNRRLYTIDSMRGIAALAVALYHIHTPAFHSASGYLIDALRSVFSFGSIGVPIFFAISGFVISSSITRVNGARQFGQFMVKRSVRLDPAYWASMALDISLTAIAIRLALPHIDLPSPQTVFLHLLYLQNLTGAGNIVEVYWTLCLEIQFYIVFGLIMAAGGSYRRPLLIAVTAYSMLAALAIAPSPPGLFPRQWCMFIIGAAAHYYGLVARDRYREFFAIMAALLAIAVIRIADVGFHNGINLAGAWLTAAALYIGAQRGTLRDWFNYKPLQYLGSRSYSIYLFHAIVGERVAKLAAIVAGEAAALPVVAILILAGSVAASIVASEVMFRLIEQPTVLLSRRLFTKPLIDAQPRLA